MFGWKQAKILTMLAILISGLLSTWFTWDLMNRRLSEDALEQARLVARSINPVRIQILKGNKADLTSPDYIRVKEQLTQIRQVHESCSFLYLMGRKIDGTIFFFVDSQPTDSKSYTPPGLVYEEVSDEYLHSFETGESRTVGPIKDRWGELITCLVPIHDSKTNKLIAVMGMDITVKNWNKKIIQNCLLPVSLTIFVMLLAGFLFILNQNRKIIKKQYNEKNKLVTELQGALEEIRTLKGIIPICMHCKEIRDDKGSWNQLEKYITEHSDAQFSHGICEKCLKEHYPDYAK